MGIDITQVLRNTELFAGVEPDLVSAVAKRAVERKLARGEVLFMAGEAAKGLYVVASGSVRAYRTGPDGREQIIHTETAGATVGELPMFDGQPYPSTVAAEEDSIVLFIEKSSFLAMCHSHPEIPMAALRALSRRLRSCAALVETLSLRAVGQRLAQLFLSEAKTRGRRVGRAIEVEIPLSKEQIAARVGSVREVVSRAMGRLGEDGLIQVSGHRVRIVDPDRLAEYIERLQ